MGIYWRLIGHYDGEAAAYAALVGAAAASPYTPTEDARLVGLRVNEGSAALTTVTTAVQFRLTCSTFKPNSIECGGCFAGLHTAPRHTHEEDWPVNQLVKAGVPVAIEGRVNGAYANVTNEVFLWGCFES
jgi:hypothetical protein